jgi:hypothetical protein
MACEMACTSASDKQALTNLIDCLNAIPGEVGACMSDAGSGRWITQVGIAAVACYGGTANMPSTACINAVTGLSDAG